MLANITRVAVCSCVVLAFAATGANAKGGSPGFHSFLHQGTTSAHPSLQCSAFRIQSHRFVRTTCLPQVHLARSFALR
jgi:hypothetical protein